MISSKSKVFAVTGANNGLGKEAARQLLLRNPAEVGKVILLCRSEEKAMAAIESLKEAVPNSAKRLEFVALDTSNLDSARECAKKLPPLKGLIMNAGGPLSKTANDKASSGANNQFQVNTLGHIVLAEALIAEEKLTGAVVALVSSEAARGEPSFKQPPPKFEPRTVETVKGYITGSSFGKKYDVVENYIYTKAIGGLVLGSLARKHKDVAFVSISPGNTSGTGALDQLSFFKRMLYKTIMSILSLLGKRHSVDKGAGRYVQAMVELGALSGEKSVGMVSGHFYASRKGYLVGPMSDQADIYDIFGDGAEAVALQDAAYEAVQSFLQ